MSIDSLCRSLGHRLVFLGLLAAVLPAVAQAPSGALRDSIDDYLRTQTRGLPGKISYSIAQFDPRTRLGDCDAFEPFLPAGGKLWGRTTIGVRCLGPSTWTIYVPVQINSTGSYLVSARPLSAGHVIAAADLAVRNGDLSALPANVVSEAAQAIGKTVRNSFSAGQVIRDDQLTAPLAIQQGQSVRLISIGAGFSVSSEGTAINNAAAGQVVQVRTSSGRSVRGIARADGSVEITH